MKKKILRAIFILAILFVPIGIMVGHSKTLTGLLTQVSKVKLLDIQEDGWSVNSATTKYINGGNILLDLDYGVLIEDELAKQHQKPFYSSKPVDSIKHHDFYMYDTKGKLIKQKLLEDKMENKTMDDRGTYKDREISKKLFYYNDNFYAVAGTVDASADYGLTSKENGQVEDGHKKYSLVKYDMDFKNLGHIEVSDEAYTNVRVKNVDNTLYVIAVTDDIAYADLSNSGNKKCEIYTVDSEFKTATSVNCNVENVGKYFPDYAFQLQHGLTDNQYDYRSDENVIISDEGKKLVYTNKNNKKIEIAADNGTYTNVKFAGNMIVAIEDTLENKNVNFFYSRIDLYDADGNLLDQVIGLNSYRDLDVDETNNKFIVSTIRLDKIIGMNYWDYLYRAYDPSFVEIGYEEYVFPKVEEPEEEPKIPNPETSDLIIIGFIAVFGVSFYLYKKCKKAL